MGERLPLSLKVALATTSGAAEFAWLGAGKAWVPSAPAVCRPSACIQLDSDYLAMCALRKSSSSCFGHGARTTRYRFRAGYRLTEVLSACPLRPAARRRTTLQPHLPRKSFVPARQPSPHPLHPMSRLLSRMRAADRWPSFTGAWTTSSWRAGVGLRARSRHPGPNYILVIV